MLGKSYISYEAIEDHYIVNRRYCIIGEIVYFDEVSSYNC